MSVIIDLAPETENRLAQKAAAEGQTLADYSRTVAERDASVAPTSFSLDAALYRAMNRTDEEKQADRDAIYATARRAEPLPPGETLESLVVGKWPGDETDEQIEVALADLS